MVILTGDGGDGADTLDAAGLAAGVIALEFADETPLLRPVFST